MPVTKTWNVTSSNPRASHADLDGETVPMNEPFSNGLMYPGDSAAGDAAEVANCTCVMSIEGQVADESSVNVPSEFSDVTQATSYDDMRAWGADRAAAWKESLSIESREAFESGTRYAYGEWNARLRAGESLDAIRGAESFQAMIEADGVAMGDSIVYRGMTQVDDAIGASFSDDGFLYTSVLPQHAGTFAYFNEGSLVEMHFPAGAKSMWGGAFEQEGELIFGSGWNFTVTGTRTELVDFGKIVKEMKIVSVRAWR